jgi:lipopolysaccharide/colanic/teichoic acid biosynthesis glycosyltransferase
MLKEDDHHTLDAPKAPRFEKDPGRVRVSAMPFQGRARARRLPAATWTPLPHERRAYWVTKRGLDIAGALAILAVFGIPMLVFALLIKLDDPKGPIFFRQKRSGLGGRRFELLKFRTMVTNADELKEQLRAHSVATWPLFKMENDPRQTRIGRFLRRTDLDELPQLLNVLKGDMSLVGPRPTSFGVEAYDLWHTGRLEYRPGVTGPWQVHGKDSMTFDERCRLEIRFFRHPSIAAEIKLLFGTVLVALQRGT